VSARLDLLLKAGRVIDPGRGIDQRLDIGIAGSRIAAVSAGIPESDARQVLDASGQDRIVVPGLIDIHAHVAYGASTAGVGMPCCKPDEAGVESGVTTLVDAGSLGVSNFGVLPAHLLPGARTDVLCFLNVGSYAHTMPGRADVESLDEIDARAISVCIEGNPGIVRGLKLRLVGAIMDDQGEAVIDVATAIAREHELPLMTHIGDPRASQRPDPGRMRDVTAALLRKLRAGDIVTHLCTPAPGGIDQDPSLLEPLVREARQRGVIMDAAVGQGHLGYAAALGQYRRGLRPDTISSDLTERTGRLHSLVECMSKFMAIGYSLPDVVRMTTSNAARAVSLQDSAGAIAVGRQADLTVLDVVDGPFTFRDARKEAFAGQLALTPVRTIKAGACHSPGPGPHPWGWLPGPAQRLST
jgi:dihydroorotase